MTNDGEFGPGGYLPQRAAQRARKIILREQMGVPWVLAAIVAALVVLGAGGWYLVTANRAPSAPYQPIGELAAVPAAGVEVFLLGEEVAHGFLVSRAAGGLQVFLAPADVDINWCAQSRRLEASDGAVWTLDGAAVGGGRDSLQLLASTVHDGQVYVDPTSARQAPAPQARGERPECT